MECGMGVMCQASDWLHTCFIHLLILFPDDILVPICSVQACGEILFTLFNKFNFSVHVYLTVIIATIASN